MPESRSGTRTRQRLAGLGTAALHLGVLWAFAFAQPLLDLLGDTPEFFVARGNTRGDILVLAFVVTLVPPLVLALVELLVGLVSEQARLVLHLVFVGVLAAAFALQLLADAVGGSGWLLVALGRGGGRGARLGLCAHPAGTHAAHGAVPGRARPAERVIAFAGSRLLASGRPFVKRPDLVKPYGRKMTRAGYDLSGWAQGPKPGSPEAPVRVSAILGDRASELRTPGAR